MRPVFVCNMASQFPACHFASSTPAFFFVVFPSSVCYTFRNVGNGSGKGMALQSSILVQFINKNKRSALGVGR